MSNTNRRKFSNRQKQVYGDADYVYAMGIMVRMGKYMKDQIIEQYPRLMHSDFKFYINRIFAHFKQFEFWFMGILSQDFQARYQEEFTDNHIADWVAAIFEIAKMNDDRRYTVAECAQEIRIGDADGLFGMLCCATGLPEEKQKELCKIAENMLIEYQKSNGMTE